MLRYTILDIIFKGHHFWQKLNNKYKSIWEMNDSGALLLLSDYQYTY